MFKRRSAQLADVPAADPADQASGEDEAPGAVPRSTTAAKGRPTPKRSEAEKRRRQPYSAPADRKAAVAQSRSQGRTERTKRYEAMRRGENWALPVKDRGPVRALARDVVDSRRRISEFYMYIVGALVVLLFIPQLRTIVDYVVLAVIFVMLIEAMFLGRQVRKLAAQRFPGERTKGLTIYSALRAMQIRALRNPKPRVKAGDQV
ncbi:MAG TPA: DUF3043 domain-containing protein [Streptosporangiaceae bacterium]